MADVADAGLAEGFRIEFRPAHRRGEHLADLQDGAVLAAADVEHLPRRAGMFQREHEGACDIVDVDEVAALAAVLEHHRALPVQEARGEDGEHAGVGIRERLAGPVDIEQPQRDAFDAVGRARASA